MGVVLRLPGRQGRAATPAATLEPAVFADSGSAGYGLADSGLAGPGLSPADPDEAERTDWAWVEEWRAGGEPTPWAAGLVLGAFAALIVGVAVWVLAAGLADRPVVAVLVNLLVAAGLAPAIWLSRGLPVLRWVGAGAAIGIVVGWISALLMLPLPPP